MPTPTPSAALSAADLATLAELVDDAASRTDEPLSLEGMDGFLTALQCAPRVIEESEFLPVLFGGSPTALFADAARYEQFHRLFSRRWKAVSRALAASIDSLADRQALAPLIMDWEAMLADLPPAEAATFREDGVPPYASMWAAGFLQVVEHWEADWELPADSKDEAFVDEMLDPLYVLITPEDEWTDAERARSREDHFALAIWSCYELRDFWRDRGHAPRH